MDSFYLLVNIYVCVLTRCDVSERQHQNRFDCIVFYRSVLTGRERRRVAQCVAAQCVAAQCVAAQCFEQWTGTDDT